MICSASAAWRVAAARIAGVDNPARWRLSIS
jgi:hypothetical protein